MLIKSHLMGFNHAVPSEITSQSAYAERRELLKHMAVGAAGVGMAGWAQRSEIAKDLAWGARATYGRLVCIFLCGFAFLVVRMVRHAFSACRYW